MSYLDQIIKPTPQAPIITIVGFPGAGKTILGATFPSPIFIQAENSTTVCELWDKADQPSFLPQIPSPNKAKGIRPSEIITAQLRELITQPHDHKTVVIDTVTALNALYEEEVVAFDAAGATSLSDAEGGYHKGYLVVAGMHARLRQACEHLRRKGISVVYLAHTGVIKIKSRPDSDADYTVYSLDLPEKSRRVYVSSSDAVLYLKSEEYIIGQETSRKGTTTRSGRISTTGDRVLLTSGDGTIGFADAKNRYGMPDKIPVPPRSNPILGLIPYFKRGKDE